MNKAIQELQIRLNALGFNVGIADGIRGAKTIAATKGFQEKFGLVSDGIAGEQTLAALKQAETPPKPVRPEPDKSAMGQPISSPVSGNAIAVPPENVASIKLLDTSRPINELIVHCAATPEGKDFTIDDIRAWHKQRGWSDIGYHYVVYRDGRVMTGRPIGQIGAHCEGHNTGTVGITYVGGVSADGKTAKDTRTPAQRTSLLWLAKKLIAKHGIKKVTGHNQYANKACPSFNVRNDALGKLVL